jgi:hypothetical protein
VAQVCCTVIESVRFVSASSSDANARASCEPATHATSPDRHGRFCTGADTLTTGSDLKHVGVHEDPQPLLERARDRDHRDGRLRDDELARRASLLGSNSVAVVPTIGAAAADRWYRDWVVRRARNRLRPSDDRTDQRSFPTPQYGNGRVGTTPSAPVGSIRVGTADQIDPNRQPRPRHDMQHCQRPLTGRRRTVPPTPHDVGGSSTTT